MIRRCSTPSISALRPFSWNTNKIYSQNQQNHQQLEQHFESLLEAQTTQRRRQRRKKENCSTRVGSATATAFVAFAASMSSSSSVERCYRRSASSKGSSNAENNASRHKIAEHELCKSVNEDCANLPLNILRQINRYLAPIDRLHLRGTCRHFNDIFHKWDDIFSMEIHLEEDTTKSETTSKKMPLTIPRLFLGAKKQNDNMNGSLTRVGSFHVQIRLADRRLFRLRTSNSLFAVTAMRTLLGSQEALKELTIWDACLTTEFIPALATLGATLKTLRLWNCGTYFIKKPLYREKVIETLMSMPQLKEMLVLDTNILSSSFDSMNNQHAYMTNSDGSSINADNEPTLHKSLAAQICASLQNIQLTNLYIPLRSMEIISDLCASSCQRLAIGCTFGKTEKRLSFLSTIGRMKNLTDIDIPPFIFRLNEKPCFDENVRKLIDSLPIIAIGFRHYNSSVLFRFVETQLPNKIRLLRVHHNANRIPNFAELGTSKLTVTKPSLPRQCIGNTIVDITENVTPSSHNSTGFDSHMNWKNEILHSHPSINSNKHLFRMMDSSNALCTSNSSISSSIMDTSIFGGLTTNEDAVATASCTDQNVRISDRLKSFKTRLMSDIKYSGKAYNKNDNANDNGRRFTIGSHFQFSPRNKLSASSVTCGPSTASYDINDLKLRKRSLDWINVKNNNNVCSASNDISDQADDLRPLPHYISSYSLDGRKHSVNSFFGRAQTFSTLNSSRRRRERVIEERDDDETDSARIANANFTPENIAQRLQTRDLTIFAISEDKRERRVQRIRKRRFCGVDVIYIPESTDTQEIFGRMASPMTSPYVYSKSLGPTRCSVSSNGTSSTDSTTPSSSATNSRYRIIKGDLVRPIPLSSLGMESDFEQSDWED